MSELFEVPHLTPRPAYAQTAAWARVAVGRGLAMVGAQIMAACTGHAGNGNGIGKVDRCAILVDVERMVGCLFDTHKKAAKLKITRFWADTALCNWLHRITEAGLKALVAPNPQIPVPGVPAVFV